MIINTKRHIGVQNVLVNYIKKLKFLRILTQINTGKEKKFFVKNAMSK